MGRPTRYIQGLKNDIQTVKYLDLAFGISRSAEAEFRLVVRSGKLEVSEAGGVSHLAIGSDKRISQHLSELERSARGSFRLRDLSGAAIKKSFQPRPFAQQSFACPDRSHREPR
jgi:hypothetical protein